MTLYTLRYNYGTFYAKNRKAFSWVNVYTHLPGGHTLACQTVVELSEAAGSEGGMGEGGLEGFTHCESTLDIPGMSEDSQIRPDGVAAFLCGITSG